MDRASTVIAILNTSPDTIELLRLSLQRAGFVVVSAFTFDVRDGRVDLEAFVRQHKPRVIVYDIAPPYEENWRLFQHLCRLDVFDQSSFVLTSVNTARVRDVAGAAIDIHEVVGKPFDLDEVVEAVVTAAHQRPSR
jgi:DNA-binding response OmpR family regulator